MGIVIRVAEPGDSASVKRLYEEVGQALPDITQINRFVLAIEEVGVIEDLYGVVGLELNGKEAVMLPVVMRHNRMKVELLRLFISYASESGIHSLKIHLQHIGPWSDHGSAGELLTSLKFAKIGKEVMEKRFELTRNDKLVPNIPLSNSDFHRNDQRRNSSGTGRR